jgi:hypothetical protein
MSLSSDDLYAINDFVTAIAGDHNARSNFADDDEYDRALNEATHAVASILRLDTERNVDQP